MGQYSRLLKNGKRWYYSGQLNGQKYFSKAIYLSKAECAKAERTKLSELESGARPSRASLLEICEKRLDYLETKTKNYFEDNKRLFKKLIDFWGANYPARAVTREMINEYLLSECKRCKAEGYDNHTVNAQIRHIKALFNFAVYELECLDRNPANRLKFFPVTKNTKYIPPDEHINLVCAYLLPHQRRIMLFCAQSACRISEALRATGKDIDIEEGFLTLWTRKKKYGDLTSRRINLPEEVAELKQPGLLFPEWKDRPRFLEKHCEVLGIPVFGWHAFRHRKASIMAKEGVPINAIQHYLGHESIVVTQQYLHLLGYRL